MFVCLTASGEVGAAESALVPDIDYRMDSVSPADPLRTLDIYYPQTAYYASPVVFYVHGGGWAIGDKSNKPTLAKAKLFNDLGYVFVSTNYRLSPNPEKGGGPDRIKHPTHINDVADALAFLVKHSSVLKIDMNQVGLIGHSSGAHLVALLAADQKLLQRRNVDPGIIKGVVVLDTLALDVTSVLNAEISPRSRSIYENAFGSLVENQGGDLWQSASPFAFADATDPPVLVITQGQVPRRVEQATHFIRALGQERKTSLFTVERSHRQINWDLGGVEDPAGITPRVLDFFAWVFVGYGSNEHNKSKRSR